ncbi:relaxase/mobilization nuclease [Streptomyces olivaceus]
MIARIYPRVRSPHDLLRATLDREPLPADRDDVPEYSVVAYWPELGNFTDCDEQDRWTPGQWAQHLDDPFDDFPTAVSPKGDRQAIFGIGLHLHSDDRCPTRAQWSEIALRLARAAGIERPGERHGCHWVAFQNEPGQLHVIANLIQGDGTWRTPSSDIAARLEAETRSIGQDLRLSSARSTHPAIPAVPTASAQLARVLTQLAEERAGPLATVRALIEHTAHRLQRQPGPAGAEAAHGLELIARRLHGIQQDLDTSAARLVQPRTATLPPPARRSAHRSP